MTPATATPETIAPYGTLVTPGEDGAPFGPADASLDLTQGTPRFYIMRLTARPLVIKGITRHARVTQCLASANGADWFIGLAPPSPGHDSPTDPIQVFRIPGGTALALRAGTWHAGPFFTAPTQDFFNLELADTNIDDHHTVRLDQVFGLRLRIAA